MFKLRRGHQIEIMRSFEDSAGMPSFGFLPILVAKLVGSAFWLGVKHHGLGNIEYTLEWRSFCLNAGDSTFKIDQEMAFGSPDVFFDFIIFELTIALHLLARHAARQPASNNM